MREEATTTSSIDSNICRLDEDLDASIPSLPLLARTRDTALIHLLRAFEAHSFKCASTEDSGARETASHYSVEGLHHAARWIFRFCPITEGRPELGFDPAAYAEAQKLHSEAREYSKCWGIMGNLHRGVFTAIELGEGLYRVSFESDFSKETHVAQTLIGGQYQPTVAVGEPVLSPQVRADIATQVRINPSARNALRYSIPDQWFSALAARIHRLTADAWELDETWDFGGYTIGQFRRYWDAVGVLSLVHTELCRKLSPPQTLEASVVRYVGRSRWEGELSRRTGLEADIVGAITEDLIYDFRLQLRRRNPAHVTFQPLMRLGGALAAPVFLAQWANIERNLWELVSIRRPGLHAQLRNRKEDTWIREIMEKLSGSGLRFFTRMNYTYGNRRGELDMLMLDTSDRFGLVMELKWQMAPGRIPQAISNDQDMAEGVAQASRALEWITENRDEVSRRIGMGSDGLLDFEFKPLVLCKRTLGSGLLRKPDVPVINERLFEWVVREPHRRSLRTLWNVADQVSYLPVRGKHFQDQPGSVGFGAVRFVLDGIAYTLGPTSWDPEKDMNLDDL